MLLRKFLPSSTNFYRNFESNLIGSMNGTYCKSCYGLVIVGGVIDSMASLFDLTMTWSRYVDLSLSKTESWLRFKLQASSCISQYNMLTLSSPLFPSSEPKIKSVTLLAHLSVKRYQEISVFYDIWRLIWINTRDHYIKDTDWCRKTNTISCYHHCPFGI